MNDLIEALTIFAKYKNVRCPTYCEYDVLVIVAVEKDEVSTEDQARLNTLGFFWSDSYYGWQSVRFGSA